MYQAKTPGFLELLMNALAFPMSRRTVKPLRVRFVPARREVAIRPSYREAMRAKETYFATARVQWWNR